MGGNACPTPFWDWRERLSWRSTGGTPVPTYDGQGRRRSGVFVLMDRRERLSYAFLGRTLSRPASLSEGKPVL